MRGGPVDYDSPPASDTHLTRRLEGFSDIVFAFSLTFVATQLEIPSSGEQLHAASMTFFLLTFAAVAILWYTHYRVFHDSFVGKSVDIVLNFIVLGGVAVLPYTLTLTRHLHDRKAVSFEGADLALIYAVFAVMSFRGLRHHGDRLVPKLALRTFRRSVSNAFVAAVFVTTSLAVWQWGAKWSLLFLATLLSLAQRSFIRSVPQRCLPETARTANGVDGRDAYA